MPFDKRKILKVTAKINRAFRCSVYFLFFLNFFTKSVDKCVKVCYYIDNEKHKRGKKTNEKQINNNS